MKVNFVKAANIDIKTDPAIVFKTEVFISRNDLIAKQFDAAYNKFIHKVDQFQKNGSGWVVDTFEAVDLYTIHYNPLRARSYMELPYWIKSKKACVNIKNQDEKCFLWSILAALHPVNRENNPERVRHYRLYEHELNMDGIEYPVSITAVTKFEKQNDIAVNILAYQDESIIPVRVSEERKKMYHVNLLLLSDDTSSHYVLIRNLSRLVGAQYNKHRTALHFCLYCLRGFQSPDVLKKHVERCRKHGCQRTELPEKGKNDILKI